MHSAHQSLKADLLQDRHNPGFSAPGSADAVMEQAQKFQFARFWRNSALSDVKLVITHDAGDLVTRLKQHGGGPW